MKRFKYKTAQLIGLYAMNQKMIHPLPTAATCAKPIHYSISSSPKIVTSKDLPSCHCPTKKPLSMASSHPKYPSKGKWQGRTPSKYHKKNGYQTPHILNVFSSKILNAYSSWYPMLLECFMLVLVTTKIICAFQPKLIKMLFPWMDPKWLIVLFKSHAMWMVKLCSCSWYHVCILLNEEKFYSFITFVALISKLSAFFIWRADQYTWCPGALGSG